MALGPRTACEYARQARLRATGCRCGERNRVRLPEALLDTHVPFGRDSRGNGLLWKHSLCEPTHSLPQMFPESPHLGLLTRHSA